MYAAAFIGRSEFGHVNRPEVIQRWGQFLIKFGGFKKAKYLAYAVSGFFENGGSKCYAVNIKDEKDENYIEALKVLENTDTAFLVAPGCTSKQVQEAIAEFCERKNILGILDLPLELGEGIAKLERIVSSEHCVYFYPWLYVWDFYGGENYVPPSGHIAGLYAYYAEKQKNSNPKINPEIKVKGLKYSFTEEEQKLLASKGINCIRLKTEIIESEPDED